MHQMLKKDRQMKKSEKQMKTQLGAQYITRAQMVSRKLKSWNPRGWTLSSTDLRSTLVAYMGAGNEREAHELHLKMVDRGVRGVHTP